MARKDYLFYNVKNLKHALRTAAKTYSTPESLAYASGLNLEADFNETKKYGDGMVIAVIADDKGLTGSVITTSVEDDYEIACARAVLDNNGNLVTIQQKSSIHHAIYYETDYLDAGVNKTAKFWLLNLTTGKASESYQQTEEDPTINTYEYSLTVLGEKLEANLTTDDFVDENGNTINVYRVRSLPGETGYATFGDAVPTVKSAT